MPVALGAERALPWKHFFRGLRSGARTYLTSLYSTQKLDIPCSLDSVLIPLHNTTLRAVASPRRNLPKAISPVDHSHVAQLPGSQVIRLPARVLLLPLFTCWKLNVFGQFSRLGLAM